MSDPILGIGTKISVNRGAGYVDIVKMVEIGEFGLEGDDVEVTNHDSTGGVREYIRGLTDPSEISFTGIWVADATQTALMDDVLLGMDQPNLPYKITLAQARGEFTFDGYLKAFTINPNLDDRLECNGTFKMAGIPSFALDLTTGLSNIVLNAAGVTVPAPAAGVYEYVNNQLNGATSVKFTVTAAAQTITVNGIPHTTAVEGASFNLGAAGSITDFVIEVSATGKASRSYHVAVVRAS